MKNVAGTLLPCRALLAVLACIAVSTQSEAQNPADGAGATAAAAWPLERITLNNGKEYQGLIETTGPATVDLIEVHRPRGKPMYLVRRPLERKEIAAWQRLGAEERKVLQQRIEHVKGRIRIEGRRMEDLALSVVRRDEALHQQYHGSWFALDSMADETMTRHLIVRIEQVFTAYRQILPPRSTPMSQLQIMLFGEIGQYRAYLGKLGFTIDNPAFYVAEMNLIAAGGELNRFSAQLAKSRRQNQEVKQEYDELFASLPKRLRALNDQLRQNGVSPGERQKVVVAEQKKWEDQRSILLRRINTLNRVNDNRFKEVAGRMSTRLFHEAFHAYLENYAYPHAQYDVPRWLNEGLAQTFEGGQVEADTLRVDAPNPRALAQLQDDLRSGNPLPLAEVLAAEPARFIPAHRGEAESVAASRLYVYSWGLAYYLTFEQPIVGTERFEEYVSPAAADVSPVDRFERLVQTRLSEFEPKWREAMLGLKS